MRLRDLDAHFLKYVGGGIFEREHVDALAEADGIRFQCPLCSVGLPVEADPARPGHSYVRGAHSVICWFVGRVPDDLDPKPGRWTPAGTGYDDLTFVPGDPPRAVSVLLTSGCGWHGHVKDGEATLS